MANTPHALNHRIDALTKFTASTTKLIDINNLSSGAEREEITRANRLVNAAIDEAHQVLKELKMVPANQPLDPDDVISNTFLEVQKEIRGIIEQMERSLERGLKLKHDRLRKRFVVWHKIVGELRTNILEHEAGYSPVIGPFDNAEDLIHSLRSH